MSPAQVVYAARRLRETQIDQARLLGHNVALATWGDGSKKAT
jgi:hypothetical protein